MVNNRPGEPDEKQPTLQWELKADPMATVGFAIAHEVTEIARGKFPDIAELFPFRQCFDMAGTVSEDQVTFVIRDKPGSNVPTINDKMSAGEVQRIRKAYSQHPLDQFPAIHQALAPDLMAPDCFAYSGPFRAPYASWQDIRRALVLWLKHFPVPTALALNIKRIQRAIPQPPQFNLDRIQREAWVLECEESIRQGTAFHLNGVELVTCQHVLGQKKRPLDPKQRPRSCQARSSTPTAIWT